MGYIEDNLMQDEQIIVEAKQHGIIYFWPYFVGFLGVVACCLAFLNPLTLVLGALLIIIAVVWGIKTFGGRRYVLTNKRIIFKRGIVERNSLELVLRKVEGVKTKQSLVGRMLDYGTVIVTTGEATNTYEWIKHPMKFSALINEQIANISKD